MRILPILLLTAALLPAAEPDPVTAQIPAQAEAFIRIASPDRFDAIAGELRPLLQIFSGEGKLPDFGKVKASDLLLKRIGIGADLAPDRSKPIYFVSVGGGTVYLMSVAEGATFEGERKLLDGQTAVVRGQALCVGPGNLLKAATRGAPTAIPEGDVVVHLFLGEMVDRNRKAIEQQLTEWAGMLKEQLPAQGKTLVEKLTKSGIEAVAGLQSLDYALMLEQGRLESVGILRTRPRSALGTYLAGIGDPTTNDLVSLLPDSFFVATDSATSPSFLLGDLAAMVDETFGANTSKSLAALMGASALCGEAMTGRGASSSGLVGMGGTSSLGIWELKDPEKAKQALRSVDADAIRKRIEALKLPLAFQYEVAAAKHGGTELHRMSVHFKNLPMMLAILPSNQSYLAVEGKYLLMATAVSAESDLKALIDTVRKGERGKHPHLAAMERLGKERNFGFTINLGALKPIFTFVAMAQQEALPIMKALPDKMLLSTAVTVRGEGIFWRGDWPLEEVTAISKAVFEMIKEKKLKEALEKEFD